LENYPELKDFYIKQLEISFTSNLWRIESFLCMDAKGRYDYILANNPQFVQRLSNKIVASYLEITQESLSRLKARK